MSSAVGKKRKVEIQPVTINNKYQSEESIGLLNAAFTGDKTQILENGVEIIKEPFSCCILPNFIEDIQFINKLRDSVLELMFQEKNNDLYKFHQSDDLKNCGSPYIAEFRELLYGKFLRWLESVTGISMNATVDMSSAQYNYTDILLCHDDRLEGRRIAYIYYLVPTNWEETDGGTLDLFSTRDNEPHEIVRSLVPKLNNFVFFEVTPYSFHQVSEILSQDKCRLSISGWFHGPSANIQEKPTVEPRITYSPIFVEEELVRAWINPLYLNEAMQMEIQEKFEQDSEIQLVHFLTDDKYEALSEYLRSELVWIVKGPANRRRTQEINLESSLPSILKECLDLFKSEAMFLILSNLTGLNLHSLTIASEGEQNNTEKARCEYSVRKWSHGCYNLIKDQTESEESDALDVNIFFNVSDWQISFGGYTSYIAKGEDEELLTVTPESNTLALVYRDKDTLKFVKHINSQVLQEPNNSQQFQDIHLIYYE